MISIPITKIQIYAKDTTNKERQIINKTWLIEYNCFTYGIEEIAKNYEVTKGEITQLIKEKCIVKISSLCKGSNREVFLYLQKRSELTSYLMGKAHDEAPITSQPEEEGLALKRKLQDWQENYKLGYCDLITSSQSYDNKVKIERHYYGLNSSLHEKPKVVNITLKIHGNDNPNFQIINQSTDLNSINFALAVSDYLKEDMV